MNTYPVCYKYCLKLVTDCQRYSLQCLVIYIRSDKCTISKKRSTQYITFTKSSLRKLIHTLYTLYISLASISVIIQEQRPLESSHSNSQTQSILLKLYFV